MDKDAINRNISEIVEQDDGNSNSGERTGEEARNRDSGEIVGEEASNRGTGEIVDEEASNRGTGEIVDEEASNRGTGEIVGEEVSNRGTGEIVGGEASNNSEAMDDDNIGEIMDEQSDQISENSLATVELTTSSSSNTGLDAEIEELAADIPPSMSPLHISVHTQTTDVCVVPRSSHEDWVRIADNIYSELNNAINSFQHYPMPSVIDASEMQHSSIREETTRTSDAATPLVDQSGGCRPKDVHSAIGPDANLPRSDTPRTTTNEPGTLNFFSRQRQLNESLDKTLKMLNELRGSLSTSNSRSKKGAKRDRVDFNFDTGEYTLRTNRNSEDNLQCLRQGSEGAFASGVESVAGSAIWHAASASGGDTSTGTASNNQASSRDLNRHLPGLFHQAGISSYDAGVPAYSEDNVQRPMEDSEQETSASDLERVTGSNAPHTASGGAEPTDTDANNQASSRDSVMDLSDPFQHPGISSHRRNVLLRKAAIDKINLLYFRDRAAMSSEDIMQLPLQSLQQTSVSGLEIYASSTSWHVASGDDESIDTTSNNQASLGDSSMDLTGACQQTGTSSYDTSLPVHSEDVQRQLEGSVQETPASGLERAVGSSVQHTASGGAEPTHTATNIQTSSRDSNTDLSDPFQPDAPSKDQKTKNNRIPDSASEPAYLERTPICQLQVPVQEASTSGVDSATVSAATCSTSTRASSGGGESSETKGGQNVKETPSSLVENTADNADLTTVPSNLSVSERQSEGESTSVAYLPSPTDTPDATERETSSDSN